MLIWSYTLVIALFTAHRANNQGISPHPVRNQLILGLLITILMVYHLIFTSQRSGGRLLSEQLVAADSKLLVYAGFSVAVLAVVAYMLWARLPLLRWLDVCVVPVLLGHILGRWGAYFGQQAAGSFQQELPETLVYSAFGSQVPLGLSALVVILWIERNFHDRLRPGDSVLLCGMLYALGSFFSKGLRFDSFCFVTSSCAGELVVGQLVSLAVFAACAGIFSMRRFWLVAPASDA